MSKEILEIEEILETEIQSSYNAMKYIYIQNNGLAC